MDPLKKVLIAILVLSLLTFIVLFGQLPALRKTPIGWLQRALSVRLPNGLRFLDQKLTGGRVTGRAQRLSHYLLYEKNPIVLVRCPAPSNRTWLLTRQDHLPLPSDCQLNPLHQCNLVPSASGPPCTDSANRSGTALPHLSDRDLDFPLRHLSKPPGSSPRLALRPHPLQTKDLLPNL